MTRVYAANNAYTTLAENIDSTQTSFTVADASVFPTTPFVITIDAEYMLVTGVTTNTLTVERGHEGSTQASHDEDALVENRWSADSFNDLWDAVEDKAEDAELESHTLDNMPHQFVDEDTSTTYKYGFKQEGEYMRCMYEEVL